MRLIWHTPAYQISCNNQIPDWKRFREEQAGFRHTGAHGLSGDDEYETMANHYQAQIVMGYIVLMKRLGFSNEMIDGFQESSFLNVARWRISREYALPEDDPTQVESLDHDGAGGASAPTMPSGA